MFVVWLPPFSPSTFHTKYSPLKVINIFVTPSFNSNFNTKFSNFSPSYTLQYSTPPTPPYLLHFITLYLTFSRMMGYNLSSYRTVLFLFPPTALNVVSFTNIPPLSCSCSFVLQGVDMRLRSFRKPRSGFHVRVFWQKISASIYSEDEKELDEEVPRGNAVTYNENVNYLCLQEVWYDPKKPCKILFLAKQSETEIFYRPTTTFSWRRSAWWKVKFTTVFILYFLYILLLLGNKCTIFDVNALLLQILCVYCLLKEKTKFMFIRRQNIICDAT